MTRRPLLLHSLREFSSLILPCLDAVEPERVVEIGGEAGLFTRELCEWARERGATVSCIEPAPLPEHHQLAETHGLQVVAGKSPNALEGLPPFDVYLVDGDHNYHVVAAEIRRAFADAESPLVIAHDVAWPCARRDQYYDPSDVPDDARHEFSYDGGASPDHRELVDGGFRGNGAFAYAITEGGPRNGVRTAIEDFAAEHGGLEFLRVPCIFGLGFVFRSDAPWGDRVREIVGPFDESDLLARLERNRLDLYLRFLDPLTSVEVAPPDRGLIASLQRQVEELEVEVARLRLEAAERAV